MRKYKYLTDDEVTYYRGLSVGELETQVDLKRKEKFKEHVSFKQIELGKPFNVYNGDWYGFMDQELDKIYFYILIDGTINTPKNDVEQRDVTADYENDIPTGLSIYYLEDDARLGEIYKIYSDKTTSVVMGGKKDCDHEFEAITYDGVHCLKCNAWSCY